MKTDLFFSEGARVVFGDVLDEEGQEVERKVSESGGEAVYVHLDVTSDADWDEAFHTAEGRFGRLDVLVNNAGIAIANAIEYTPEELWDGIMAVNTKGVFLETRKVLPALRRAGGGCIINISSIAGPVDTPMLSGVSDNPEILRQRTAEVPLGRSRDIAYGALYLASDEAAWVTGIELIIVGGITAK